jgi:hypothetical protein
MIISNHGTLKGNPRHNYVAVDRTPGIHIPISPKICLSLANSSHGLNIIIQYRAGPIWRRGRQRPQRSALAPSADRVLQSWPPSI